MGMDNTSEIKVVLVGDAASGKTRLFNKYLHNRFDNDDYDPTIGASFCSKKNAKLNLAIWDTAGQARYQSLTPMYTNNADIIILTLDLTNTKSLDMLKKLKLTLKPDAVKVLVATKSDLTDQHVINLEDEKVAAWITEQGFHNNSVYQTSAKTGDGVDALFKTIKSIAFDKISSANVTTPQKENAASTVRPQKKSTIKKSIAYTARGIALFIGTLCDIATLFTYKIYDCVKRNRNGKPHHQFWNNGFARRFAFPKDAPPAEVASSSSSSSSHADIIGMTGGARTKDTAATVDADAAIKPAASKKLFAKIRASSTKQDTQKKKHWYQLGPRQ